MTTKKGRLSKDAEAKGYSEGMPEPFRIALDEIHEMREATETLRKVEGKRQKPLLKILDEMDGNIRAAAESARRSEEAARAAREAALSAVKATALVEKSSEEARQAGEKASEMATRAAKEAADKAEAVAKASRLAAEVAARKAEEADKGTKKALTAFKKAAEGAARRVEEASAVASEEAGEALIAARKAIAESRKASRSVHSTEAVMLQRIKLLEGRLAAVETSLPNEKIILLREIPREQAEKDIKELFLKGEILYYSDIAEALGLDLQLVVEICNELQSKGDIKVVGETLQSR